MKLDVGVLIVGSLYWDDKPHREKWRNDRLQMERAVGVEVPIRYGRKARSRGYTYTMVFSVGCELGQGKAVPCSRSISRVEELIEEAECLWAAEQPEERSQRGLSADWGCVALLAHPRFQKNCSEVRQILGGWSKRIALEQKFKCEKYDGPDGSSLVDKRAILQIPWPNRTDGSGPLALDLALATATMRTLDPKTQGYPSARAIAQAWKDDKEGYANYFWHNREHGVRTFQDEEIERYLRP